MEHKRVYRIYRDLELNRRIKMKKRLVREKPEPLVVSETINQAWSMDFMHDRIEDNRTFRLLNRNRSRYDMHRSTRFTRMAPYMPTVSANSSMNSQNLSLILFIDISLSPKMEDYFSMVIIQI